MAEHRFKACHFSGILRIHNREFVSQLLLTKIGPGRIWIRGPRHTNPHSLEVSIFQKRMTWCVPSPPTALLLCPRSELRLGILASLVWQLYGPDSSSKYSRQKHLQKTMTLSVRPLRGAEHYF